MINAETRARGRLNANRAVKGCAMALFMAAASRAAIAPGASPFAIACFTAGLYAGSDYRWLLVGCALGCPWENMTLGGVATVAGCLAALGIWEAEKRLAESRTRVGLWLAAAPEALLASAVAVIPGLISGVASGDPLSAVACAIIAQALAPVALCARSVAFSRKALLGEERLSLCVLTAIALFGLAGSPAGFLSGALAAFVTLVASYSGAAQGAAAGTVVGALTALASSGAGYAAPVGVAGLIAGLTLPLGRGWSALAFALCNLIGVMYSGFFDIAALSPLSCVMAGAIYALLNEDIVERLSGWITPRASVPDAAHLASRLNLATRNRLSALEKVFETLADGYGDFPVGPDEQSMTAKLRQALCEGCPGYAACWNGNGDRAGRLLCSLLATTLKGGVLRETDELPPEAARDCRRSAIIPRKLAPILRSFYDEKKRAALSRASAAVLARHFTSAKDILARAVVSLETPVGVDGELCQAAEAALEREGFSDARVIVLSGESVEIAATRREIWLEDEARQAQSALSKALALPLRAAFSRGGDVTLRLVQAPKLSAAVGYACRPLAAQAPCGDSYVATALGAGRVLIALSDGMGSGVRAAGESARTVELIRRFLQADIGERLTLDAINQLLLLRGDDEMYATADVCVIDLNSAKARFIKQGACASYIIRENGIESIDGGKLPLGIIDEVSPCSREITLSPGETIVMLTDGVCDGACDEDCEWLTKTLRDLSGENSDAICRELVKSAFARRESNPDDMTAIAVSIAAAGR